MKSLLIFVWIISLVVPTFAQKRTTGLLEAKSRLEELISQRLRSTIATTLDKQAFDISVNIKMVEAPIKKVEPVVGKEKTETGTLDLSVGLVDADALIRKYEDEIKNLREREAFASQRLIAEAKPEFLVRSIEVFVGLEASLGEVYAKELETWIKKRLTPDFGSAAAVSVSLLKTTPKTPEPVPTVWDWISKFQSLLGYLLIALTAILGILLIKFLSSKDAKEQRKLTAQLQQNMRLQQDEVKALPAPEDKEPELPSMPTAYELEAIRELQGKIIWSSSENIENLNRILHGWIEAGDRGFTKTAVFMDVLIAMGGRNDGRSRGLSLEWDKVIPPQFQKRMRETFEEMAYMIPADKIQALEEVYWDLMSVKTLGAHSLTAPFQYVAAIPMGEVRSILEHQQPQVRALVVLHMSEDVRGDYLKKLPLEGKREIIEQTLQMDQVLNTDIETASETLKYSLRRNENSTKTVSLKSMAPKLLDSMSATDEIMLLKELSEKMSDGALSIKRSFPTLTFVGEWPSDKIKLVFMSASSDEVMALLRLLPELKSKVLPLCAPRVQTMVEGDLHKEDQMTTEIKDKNLSSLKLRMLQVMNGQAIQLEDIFPESESPGGLRVAS